jgi:hypothetical protein
MTVLLCVAFVGQGFFLGSLTFLFNPGCFCFKVGCFSKNTSPLQWGKGRKEQWKVNKFLQGG